MGLAYKIGGPFFFQMAASLGNLTHPGWIEPSWAIPLKLHFGVLLSQTKSKKQRISEVEAGLLLTDVAPSS